MADDRNAEIPEGQTDAEYALFQSVYHDMAVYHNALVRIEAHLKKAGVEEDWEVCIAEARETVREALARG